VDNQFIASNDFLKTYEWRKARQQVLDKYDSRCMCCGTKPTEDKYLCVDHIKPRKTHPELALDVANLQILCNECNHGKGNWSIKDYRGNGTFIITEQWLNDNCTTKGGYTKEQFKSIEASNKTGWKKRLAGTKITEDQRVAFEEAKFITSAAKIKLASTKDDKFVKKSIANANNLNEWQVEIALLRAEVEAMKVEMKRLTRVVRTKINKATT